MDVRECYAITAPGLEEITAGELRDLGLKPRDREPGGVTFGADLPGLWKANLQLRTASRIVARVGEFRATAFFELEKRARTIPWADLVAPGATVTFRVTSRKSKLYHGKAVAERLGTAVVGAVPGVTVVKSAGGADEADKADKADEADEADKADKAAKTDEVGGSGIIPPLPSLPPQLFIVRLFHDVCTISIDSSGELLHRRGYRQAAGRAPLRETLAAAMLLGSGWDGQAPLIDPMCGSGTIPIEAALIARRIPPGWHRRFAFERWPEFPEEGWRDVRARAEEAMLPRAPGTVLGSDRDAGAISSSEANAVRAGVGEDVTFRRCAVSAIEPPADVAGWIITNPPYGVRVGDRLQLRNLFAQLGNVIRRRFPGWQIALLAADRGLEGQVAIPLRPVWASRNGGLAVRLVQGRIPLLAGERRHD